MEEITEFEFERLRQLLTWARQKKRLGKTRIKSFVRASKKSLTKTKVNRKTH